MLVMDDLSVIFIRPAVADDDAVLTELSELDSARALDRPALLAFVDGRPVAAASQADGRVVADPFAPTAAVVDLLHARVARKRRVPSLRRPALLPPRLRAA